jgi:transposase
MPQGVNTLKEVIFMTKYREILRLYSLGFSQQNIAYSCSVSKKTVNRVINQAKELNIAWPFDNNQTDAVLDGLFNPSRRKESSIKRMPDLAYIRKELLKNGVSKKLLWTEYMEECRLKSVEPLMYTQFCYYIQQDEEKHRATMHINRKPGEQVEVDWAGDPAHITDPDTGEIIDAHLFVGAMTYSQYTYVEAFINEKQQAWIVAHVHMYEYFGGVARILVPDNCKTAVVHNGGWYNQQLNSVYQEMAEHYGTAIIPARVRKPKDKPNAEGSVANISTWITAALRNEQFFSLAELNQSIREKLKAFNIRLFQKKEGSRLSLFRDEELPLLAPLPATPYELAEWKQATVQFNYHISIESMLYSVPYEFIKRKVDTRITDKTIEIFYNHNRIASHRRLYGRKGQYSTIVEHMPEDHQKYLEWNGDRFRKWAEKIGQSTYMAVDSILTSKRVEQQTYRSCMGLLKLAGIYSDQRLDAACTKALSYTSAPSYKNIKNILTTWQDRLKSEPKKSETTHNNHGITRGADYYGGKHL